ncbi:transglycosylase domain-containing protein [Saccharopolyspora sp. NPDC000359]|uniref:transglycosylase domain-containing protein n=1 Tax=Saccharopolyspora sp. NPDC000359 TaxID=3154251 RepID=UPI00331673D7
MNGASGAANGGGAGEPREPQLLTHQEQGNYNYYADDFPDDDPYDNYDDGRGDARYGDDRDGDDGFDDFAPADDDPDDEMSARRRKRSRLWRRVRRTCYVATALFVLAPVAVFIYGYNAWEAPDQAKVMDSERPVDLLYANGEPMARVTTDKTREVVNSISDVSPAMRNATLAAEDASFYDNPGFDFMGIARSVYFMLTGSGVGGGSTITQQFLKLDQDLLKDPTYVRKIKEVVLAYKLTNDKPKDEILLAYMNTASYGRGTTGIKAASHAYFGKEPSELNNAEAAVLAGVVQSPYGGNDPGHNKPEKAKKRWEYVVGQMEKNGFLQPGERETMQLPETLPRESYRKDSRLTPEHDAIWDAVKAELNEQGLSEDLLSRGGYQIKTTIDPDAQKKAEEAVHSVMDPQPETLRTSLVAVDPETGGVLAYYGSKQNRGDLDWASTPQNPGSSFKPFVVAAGLEQGLGIGEYYDGSDNQVIAGTPFRNSEGIDCDTPTHCGVREAMTKSVNTVFVHLATKVGTPKVAEAAYEAGISRSTPLNRNGIVESGIALGLYPVLPTDMAGAYGTFVNGGQRVKPHFVSEAFSSVSGEYALDIPDPEPAFGSDAEESKDIAYNVAETMKDVASSSKVPLKGNRPVWSKTGTHQWGSTDLNQNAWMVGATPQISTAVAILNNDEDGPIPLKDANGKTFYGSKYPSKVWQKFMDSYLQGKKQEKIPKGDPIGQFEDIPLPPPTSETSEPPTEPLSETQDPSGSRDPSESNDPTSTTKPSRDCGGIFEPPCPPGNGNGNGDGDEEDGDNGGANNVAPTDRPRYYG